MQINAKHWTALIWLGIGVIGNQAKKAGP